MIKRIFPFLFGIIVLGACQKEDDSPETVQKSTSINKIMPLGASRVEGDRPDFESYRYELWKDLKDGGWTFDFVGTEKDAASYPSYNDQDFDGDHEGRGGFTSGQILSGLESWLEQTGAPDIVLFSSPGGNDALQEMSYEKALSNTEAIIDILQNANPKVTILIEQMAPAHSDAMTSNLSNWMDKMQKDLPNIANAKSTASSNIVVVNMHTDFKDSYLADDVHYNEAGAEFVAARYYEVLKAWLES